MMEVGFGGGCHWCTEGVFQSLIGVDEVRQGWIASYGEHEAFSEGVLVKFEPEIIGLEDLIAIHLHTHASTSEHTMRNKYRSAIYVFSEEDKDFSESAIEKLQMDFDEKIITKVLLFQDFSSNRPALLNYLYTRPEAAFCQKYIHPKLKLLIEKFSAYVDRHKIDTIF